MDREQRVCPTCGQPVQSVIQRHKTLGAWVPRWVPGPCHNPKCDAHVGPDAEPERESEEAPEQESGQRPDAHTAPTS